MAKPKKKRGLKKGQTNNPTGRPPSIGTAGATAQISVRLDANRLDKLRGLAAVEGVGLAEMIRRLIDAPNRRMTEASATATMVDGPALTVDGASVTQ